MYMFMCILYYMYNTFTINNSKIKWYNAKYYIVSYIAVKYQEDTIIIIATHLSCILYF